MTGNPLDETINVFEENGKSFDDMFKYEITPNFMFLTHQIWVSKIKTYSRYLKGLEKNKK